MIVFPDVSSHVLEHPTPVVPVQLDGRLDRGLAMEAAWRWPGFEAAYRAGLAAGPLSAESPRVMPWPTGTDQLALLAPVAVGQRDRTTRGQLTSTRLAIASLESIGPAAIKAGRSSVGLPPLRCGPEGPAPEALMTWLGETAADYAEVDWHIYWWPRAGFDTPGMQAILKGLVQTS